MLPNTIPLACVGGGGLSAIWLVLVSCCMYVRYTKDTPVWYHAFCNIFITSMFSLCLRQTNALVCNDTPDEMAKGLHTIRADGSNAVSTVVSRTQGHPPQGNMKYHMTYVPATALNKASKLEVRYDKVPRLTPTFFLGPQVTALWRQRYTGGTPGRGCESTYW